MTFWVKYKRDSGIPVLAGQAPSEERALRQQNDMFGVVICDADPRIESGGIISVDLDVVRAALKARSPRHEAIDASGTIAEMIAEAGI